MGEYDSCQATLEISVTEKMLADYPELMNFGNEKCRETKPGDMLSGSNPFDNKVRLMKCHKGSCRMFWIRAGSFGSAARLIKDFFPAEDKNITPKITGEYPNSCSTPERRAVAYCIVYTSRSILSSSLTTSKDDMKFLEEHSTNVKFPVKQDAGEDPLEVPQVDISKMNTDDLKRYISIIDNVLKNPPKWFTDTSKKAFEVTRDELKTKIDL
ncbi:hypothetical protein KKA47_07605 [bacterium]|nr:hypothetical protein [bacterium]